MKKQFIFNVAFRLKGCTSAPIQEMQLVAHSLQDVKSAFALWQLRTQNLNASHPEFRYVMVNAVKLKEIEDTQERKEWLRLNPSRVKSQIYVCPYCQETCYSHSRGCDYKFCPRCGRGVL